MSARAERVLGRGGSHLELSMLDFASVGARLDPQVVTNRTLPE